MTVGYAQKSGNYPPIETAYVENEKCPPNMVYETTVPQYAQPPPPPPPQTTYVQVVPVTGYVKIRSQSIHTSIAGILLFAYGGMDMAQGLGWNLYSGVLTTMEYNYSWFVGVIIGACLSALLVSHIPKWGLYLLTGLLELTDGIIFVSAQINYNAILAARYLGGIGIGILTVTFLIHNSETMLKNRRGQLAALEQYGIALGIAIHVIMAIEWDELLDINLNIAHGIFGIVFSLFATSSVAFSVESPIYHLRKNDEATAKLCQRMLVNRIVKPNAFNEAFTEAKLYVSESSKLSVGQELGVSLLPFIWMLICRCLVALTFSIPLSALMFTGILTGNPTWYSMVWGALRWVGTSVTLIFVDKLGRKGFALVGLLCMAALTLSNAGLLGDSGTISLYDINQVCHIAMAFQFFAGMYASITSTYLSEAFPMKIKPYLIGLIVCIEQVVHIIVICSVSVYQNYLFTYFLATGIIFIIGMLILAAFIPETRNLSLLQATERFRRRHNMRDY